MSKQFSSFGEFAKYISSAPERLKNELTDALNDIGQVVEELAQSKPGSYQDAVGPFGAWPELAQSTKTERLILGFTENDPLYRTGELASSYTHIVDAPVSVTVGSQLAKAAEMEYGIDNVPARPVLGPAMFEESYRNTLRLKYALLSALSKE